MVKKLICWIWGHKTLAKAYTGESMVTESIAGFQTCTSLYKWKRFTYCLRCGKDIHPESTSKKATCGGCKYMVRLAGDSGPTCLQKHTAARGEDPACADFKPRHNGASQQ